MGDGVVVLTAVPRDVLGERDARIAGIVALDSSRRAPLPRPGGTERVR